MDPRPASNRPDFQTATGAHTVWSGIGLTRIAPVYGIDAHLGVRQQQVRRTSGGRGCAILKT